MFTSVLTRRLFWTVEAILLVATILAACLIAGPAEWRPIALVILLLAVALLGQSLSIETSSGELSASLVAIVMAMALLGPAPAALCGVSVAVLRSATARLAADKWLTNLSAFAVVPFAGGLVIHLIAGGLQRVNNPQFAQDTLFGLAVLGVFCGALIVNFFLIALDTRVNEGGSLLGELRHLFLPLLPGQLAAGLLATILAMAYRSAGLPVLFGSVAVLLILRHLTVALLRSEERAEQVQARSRQLVGLQLGVLRTLVRALNMRDEATGRHAAAVARSARMLAKAVGCSEQEVDAIHAAGLLHEIGKFTWPDRILHAETIAEDDLPIVKDHPREGSILVGALDGYGEAADAILYHHERIDGRGYPAGLIGNEIPLASRVLAICCTYDTMTAGQSYRAQMSPQEAMEELRNGAKNGQFDGDLVERFIGVLEQEGTTLAQDGDFELELEFERRVSEMAEPRASAA